MEERIRKCKEIDKKLNVLEEGFFTCVSHESFDSSNYNAIHYVLENYGIDVSHFIRIAIKEKLKKDWKSIKEKKEKLYCPF
jgi:hypothetical protein